MTKPDSMPKKDQIVTAKYVEVLNLIKDSKVGPDDQIGQMALYYKVITILGGIYDAGERAGLGISDDIKNMS